MLELADEFIDSAIHFACKLAQHRGSDTLEVRDLQLHLGALFYGQVLNLDHSLRLLLSLGNREQSESSNTWLFV